MEILGYVLCLLLSWIAIHFLLSTTKKTNQKPPPGPTPIPIFGNMFSLGTKPHISLANLSKIYGPLIKLKLGQITCVVISSDEMAKEALRKNDVSFANRHVLDAVRAFNYYENSMAWLPASLGSSEWLTLRKICNSQVFSTSRLDASQDLRKLKIKELISFIEKSSEEGSAIDIGQATFTTTLNLLSNTIFSIDLGDPKSEFATELRSTMRLMLEELGKPNLADYFPFLQKFDPQGIRRRTGIYLGKVILLFKDMIKQRLEGKGEVGLVQGHDVLDALLGRSHHKNEELLETSKIPYLLLDLFFAGTDTTTTTIEWAMAELLYNPEKFKKAQKELKEVIREGNPIQEDDISQLPYLQAIIKETLRLHPPVPLLVPRKIDTDVKLFDYTLPKNSQILVNVWAIGRDPRLWENPFRFEPERFLGLEIDFKGRDFGLIPFGAGRRICPGLPLANRMVPLILGSLIHEFNWKLEDGTSPEKMDMEEKFGISLEKAQRLRVIPVRV